MLGIDGKRPYDMVLVVWELWQRDGCVRRWCTNGER